MPFNRDQPIIISQGWNAAGRKGKHICTVEVEGRTWHVVALKGDAAPTVLMSGTIEIDLTASRKHEVLPKQG
jgi:hypothetical protein